MIPSTCVVLENFPLTPDGEVDRKALPAPSEKTTPAVARSEVEPGSETESTYNSPLEKRTGA